MALQNHHYSGKFCLSSRDAPTLEIIRDGLLTNSLKHVFSVQRGGPIDISF
ncbi:hypothetical protein [Bartonella sp. AU55XJBT]|uniref:hypothetical protein n=1 Tax=Bartonella sp. AU55XJBT TaxID=3019091 RepID=UPI0038576E10